MSFFRTVLSHFILFPEISVDVKVLITAWDAFFPRESVLRSSEDREYGGEDRKSVV